GPNWSFGEIAKRLNEENKNGSGTGVGVVLNGSRMGVGVNLPGVEWDKTFFCGSGMGQERKSTPVSPSTVQFRKTSGEGNILHFFLCFILILSGTIAATVIFTLLMESPKCCDHSHGYNMMDQYELFWNFQNKSH
ncbi:hypothetical protein XENOCAPTIV_026942, partial [Xenoophorus captivus]